MTRGERMQLARRHDPYPWTWEPAAGTGVLLVALLILGVQVGRGLANLVAGVGFTWPLRDHVVTSVGPVLGGDPAAGLAHPHRMNRLAQAGHMASPGMLHSLIVVIEILVLAGFLVGAVFVLRAWGPWRMLGMASREEAERLLGRTRLRKVAGVVRPDLYGRQTRTRLRVTALYPATLEGRDETSRPAPGVIQSSSSPLGRGLATRFLLSRKSPGRPLSWPLRGTPRDAGLDAGHAKLAEPAHPRGPAGEPTVSREWR